MAIGPLRLTGLSAQLALFVLAAVAVFLVIHYRARILATPLTISALLWIAFLVYWSAAASKAARAVRSETERSRAVHRNLMLLAFVLLFGPLPWLDRANPSARRDLGRCWSRRACRLTRARDRGEAHARPLLERRDHPEDRPRAHSPGPYRFVRHPIYTAIIGMFSERRSFPATCTRFLAPP